PVACSRQRRGPDRHGWLRPFATARVHSGWRDTQHAAFHDRPGAYVALTLRRNIGELLAIDGSAESDAHHIDITCVFMLDDRLFMISFPQVFWNHADDEFPDKFEQSCGGSECASNGLPAPMPPRIGRSGIILSLSSLCPTDISIGRI